jgi:hypothetical protein
VRAVFLLNRRRVTDVGLPRARHAGWRRHRGSVPRLGLTLILLFVPVSASAQASVPAEYRAKASFLMTFPSFIDWPESAFLSAQAPFLVCVLGDFRFGTTLAESARSASPHGRLVDVRWVRRDREARNCQILFVSESEAKRYAGILQAVHGRGILTVGETMDFLSAGGMLSFSFQNGTLQFDVNLVAANEAHLRVSSRLLVLARRVLNNPESSDGYITAQSTGRKVE